MLLRPNWAGGGEGWGSSGGDRIGRLSGPIKTGGGGGGKKSVSSRESTSGEGWG